MKSFIIFSILFFISFSVQAYQSGNYFSGGLDTDILYVIKRGLWMKGDEYGSYRVVVINKGWEHTRSFLFLQWLYTDDSQKQEFEHKTITIPEFNERSWKNVMRIEYQNDSFIIYYKIRGKEGDFKAILTPGIPPVYKIHLTESE